MGLLFQGVGAGMFERGILLLRLFLLTLDKIVVTILFKGIIICLIVYTAYRLQLILGVFLILFRIDILFFWFFILEFLTHHKNSISIILFFNYSLAIFHLNLRIL